MALTKRQTEEYSGMSFEEMCDLIDQYKSNEEDFEDKISNQKDYIEELEQKVSDLEQELSDIKNN